jgi:hypothetical protein
MEEGESDIRFCPPSVGNDFPDRAKPKCEVTVTMKKCPFQFSIFS